MSVTAVERICERGQARFYRRELDLLRLAAFSLVFIGHSFETQTSSILNTIGRAGMFGVPVFFTLSAYLITEILTREKIATGTVDLWRFYVRRILRIWPLYFVVLFAGFALTHMVGGAVPISLRALLAYLFLVGNCNAGMHGFLRYGMGVLWSIGVEEQFYLVWPILMKYAEQTTLAIVCLLLWIASQAFTLLLCIHSQSSDFVWCSTLTNMQYFAIGGMLSILLAGKLPSWNKFGRTFLILGGLAVFLLFPRNESSARFLPFLMADIGVLLLILGSAGAEVPQTMSGIVYLGKISYGLYVFHLIVLDIARHLSHGRIVSELALGVSGSILVAHLSYRYLERPFLRLKERFEVVPSRPA
jgi:peptidoglycan/LPS O-acetylase OafA/YrhL